MIFVIYLLGIVRCVLVEVTGYVAIIDVHYDYMQLDNITFGSVLTQISL